LKLTKKTIIAVSIIAAVAVLAAALGAYSAKSPVGLVTYVTGKAQVKRAKEKKWQPAGQGMQLFEGDVFRTVSGGKATIMHPDGSLTRLAQNTTLALSPKFAKQKIKPKKNGPVLVASLWGSVNSAASNKSVSLSSAVAGIRESEAIQKKAIGSFKEESLMMPEPETAEPEIYGKPSGGGSGGSGQTPAPAPAKKDFLMLISPSYTGITASDTIEFAWAPRVPADYVYKLTVSRSDDLTQEWATITTATSVVYPPGEPALPVNTGLNWKVEAFYKEIEPAFSADSFFTIISDTSKIAKLKKELAASKSDPVTSRLLLAALYDEMFLKQAALAEYLSLEHENPSVPMFKNLADGLAIQMYFDDRTTALFEKFMLGRKH